MNGETLKILLIEDDEDDYILTSELLREVKRTNYDITWISKYSDCLAAILSGNYNICLIDYRLGEGDGVTLVREATARGCRTPMILLTGQGDSEIDIEATEAGAADYLVKGEVEVPLLERTIRYALARGKMLESLGESERRFRSVVESANDAIILTDGLGKIISWNNGAHSMFRYSENEIIGQPFATLFSGGYSDIHSTNHGVNSMIAAGLLHPESKAVETKGVKSDGSEFPLEISISSWEAAEGTFYSGIIRDVTERKSLEDQLTHQALHDPLTKLANRVLFSNRVEHALTRVDRNHSSVAVLFLDLDNFKTINDTLGHAAGDQLLISVARRLEACLRTSDTAARLGGDEFAVLVEDTNREQDAVFVAERVKNVLQTPFLIAGKEVFVGTSIGIASATANENPAELLRNADVAMYMAKSQGKNRYAVFESEMHDALLKRAELETDLRRAVERSEFVIHYQPIMDLKSDLIMGMEALVRWNHPQHGLLGPDEFISIAEETNLIEPLGRWILEEACCQAHIWRTRFGYDEALSITVNISSRQFQDDTLVDTVAAALEKSGLSPDGLILEITESTMLRSTDDTITKLHELKALGVRLAIDDFGTGYSSLSYLQRFPVDVLKIDKSFIAKICQGTEGAAVARAIIMMSDTLHLNTIAEGIESPNQITALQELGCGLGQGFHFARPLDVDAMSSFLKTTREKPESWILQEIGSDVISDIVQ